MSRQYIAKVEPNWLDKAITVLSPERGAARMKARTHLAIFGAYSGARTDRRATANWFPFRGSADSDTLYDLLMLRSRSRDLIRNSPLAGGAIHTVCLNAVGTGLSLQPTPDMTILKWDEEKASAWASMVEHEFAMWADSKDCDVTRTQNFYGMQDLVLRSSLESGDCFALLPMRQVGASPYKTAVQIIEADRVMSPYGHVDGMPIQAIVKDASGHEVANGNQIWAGVEVDAYGAPVAYLVYHKHPGSPDFMAGYKDNTLFDRVPAFGAKTNRRNVVHLFDRLRPDQKRGVPYLSPVIETIKQLDRYTEAEIMAAVVTAMFTVFITTPEDANGAGPLAPPSGSLQPNAIPGQPSGVSMGPGMINQLGPGEDVSFANTLRPNSGFDPFVVSILRQIGVGLQLPFEILIKHFTASYSAARAAMLEAWKFYKNRRTFIADGYCQPVYEAWFDEAVAIGRISAPGYFSDPLLRRAYLSASWIGDAPGSIDPGKDAAASQLLVDGGFSTVKREALVLTGQNFDDIHTQRAREHKLRSQADLEPGILNALATEKVDGDPNAPEPDGADTETPAKSGKSAEPDGDEPKPATAPKPPAKKPVKGKK